MDLATMDIYTAYRAMPLIEAMERIDKNARGILYVIDEKKRLLGSVTDGDIRRWILKGGELKSEIDKLAFKKTVVSYSLDRAENLRLMWKNSIHSIPVVDKDGIIIDIQFEPKHNDGSAVECDALHGVDIIIMAGGKGTRLYPYTKILPKPLIPIGDVPILERIINRLCIYGANHFYITLNYKKDMIKSYFGDIEKGYEIDFVEEKDPLGTAGSITLIDRKLSDTVIVTNCDILIEADYGDVYDYHKASDNAVTIVSSSKRFSVPYGVLYAGDGGIINSMEEKPSFSFFINTGMYFIKSRVFERIPANTVYHMTDLLSDLMRQGERVGMYPISEGSFLDMGEIEEMKRMEERVNAECGER